MITEKMLTHWASLTLREGLAASPLNSAVNWQPPPDGKGEKARFLNHLISLRRTKGDFRADIFNGPMTGSLSQGWRDLNSDAIFFQDCLEDVIQALAGTWTPADYLLQCYIAGKKNNIGLAEMDLVRALRNLPSYLREELIAGALSELAAVNIEIPTALSNAQEHVDFIIKTGGQTIYVWSYLATPKAIGYLTQNKITENRGKVLRGMNLLAPFSKTKDSESFLDWWVPSKAYIGSILEAIGQPPISYEAALQLAKNSVPASHGPFHEFLLFEKK